MKDMEEQKAYKEMNDQLDVDFTKDKIDDHDKMRDFFKVSQDKGQVDHMNDMVFDMLYKRMKERQLHFYAFLNKEFNIINYKSARCSMHCFDRDDKPLHEVNKCLKICRQGIEGCKDYAFNQQKQAEDELDVCHQQAKDQKNLSDPVIHWISCYEKLILKFDNIEKDIKDEFSNFI